MATDQVSFAADVGAEPQQYIQAYFCRCADKRGDVSVAFEGVLTFFRLVVTPLYVPEVWYNSMI